MDGNSRSNVASQDFCRLDWSVISLCSRHDAEGDSIGAILSYRWLDCRWSHEASCQDEVRVLPWETWHDASLVEREGWWLKLPETFFRSYSSGLSWVDLWGHLCDRWDRTPMDLVELIYEMSRTPLDWVDLYFGLLSYSSGLSWVDLRWLSSSYSYGLSRVDLWEWCP